VSRPAAGGQRSSVPERLSGSSGYSGGSPGKRTFSFESGVGGWGYGPGDASAGCCGGGSGGRTRLRSKTRSANPPPGRDGPTRERWAHPGELRLKRFIANRCAYLSPMRQSLTGVPISPRCAYLSPVCPGQRRSRRPPGPSRPEPGHHNRSVSVHDPQRPQHTPHPHRVQPSGAEQPAGWGRPRRAGIRRRSTDLPPVAVTTTTGRGRAAARVVFTALEGGSSAVGSRPFRDQRIRVLVDRREGTRVRVWRALGRAWCTVAGPAALSYRCGLPAL
jgi:hypothetical protein